MEDGAAAQTANFFHGPITILCLSSVEYASIIHLSVAVFWELLDFDPKIYTKF